MPSETPNPLLKYVREPTANPLMKYVRAPSANPLMKYVQEPTSPSISLTHEQVEALPNRVDVDEASVQAGGDFDQPRTDIGGLRSVGNDVMRGVGGMASSIGGLVDSFNRYALGKETDIGGKIQGKVEDWAPVNPETSEGFMTGTLPRGAGSMLTFLVPGALAGKIGQGIGLGAKGIRAAQAGAATGLGTAVGAGEAYREGKALEATDSQLVGAMVAKGLLGATEAYPWLNVLKRANRLTGGKVGLSKILEKMPLTRDPGAFQKVLADGIAGAIEEGGQEILQEYGSNQVTRHIFGQDIDPTEGLGEAGGAGTILGGAANLVASALGARRARISPEKQSLPPEESAQSPEKSEEKVLTEKVKESPEKTLNLPSVVEERALELNLEKEMKEVESEVRSRQEPPTSPPHPEAVSDGPLNPEGPEPQVERKRSQLRSFSRWIRHPMHLLRDVEGARDDSLDVVLGEMRYGWDHHNDTELFKRIGKSLKHEERIAVKPALDLLQDGQNEEFAALEQEKPRVAKAALEVRDYFDHIRESFKAYKREMFDLELEPEEAAAFKDWLQNRDVAGAAETHGVKPENLQELVDDWNEIDTWGLDDYVTRIELGSFLVKDKEGTVRAVAVTPGHAKRRALELAEKTGETQFEVVNRFDGDNAILGLTKRRRGIVKRNMRRELGKVAERLNAELEAEGSDIRIDPKQAQGVVDKSIFEKGEKGIFAGPTIERTGVLEGERDIFKALRAYSFAMRKKMTLDPIHTKIRKNLAKGGYPEWASRVLEDQIDASKGKHSAFDQFVDELFDAPDIEKEPGERLGRKMHRHTRKILNKVGDWTEPGKGSTASRMATKAGANIALGWRLPSVMTNLIGGEVNTVAGTKFTAPWRARNFLKTPEGRAWLKENEYSLGTRASLDIAGELRDEMNLVELIKPLGMFQGVETFIRPRSLAANFLLYRDKLRKENPELGEDRIKELATREAQRALSFQQGIYVMSAIPKAMRHPVSRVGLQFKSFLIRQLELVSTLPRGRQFVYMSAMLAIGGPRAFFAILKSLPFMIPFLDVDDKAVEEAENWMDRNYPDWSSGVPGWTMGVDVSSSLAPLFPNDWEDWLGILAGSMAKAVQANMEEEWVEGMPITEQPPVIKATEDIFSQIRALNDAVTAFKTSDGKVRETDRLFWPTGAGRPVYEFGDDWEWLKGVTIGTGFQTTQGRANRNALYLTKKRERERQKEASALLGKIVDLRRRPDEPGKSKKLEQLEKRWGALTGYTKKRFRQYLHAEEARRVQSPELRYLNETGKRGERELRRRSPRFQRQ